MTNWLAIAMTAAFAGAPASSGDVSSVPSLSGFRLADFTVQNDDDRDEERYLLPDVAESYGPAKAPPKLRIRGRKIRLRVPIG